MDKRVKGWELGLERERTGEFKCPGAEGNSVNLNLEEGRTGWQQGRFRRKQRVGHLQRVTDTKVKTGFALRYDLDMKNLLIQKAGKLKTSAGLGIWGK